MLIPAEKFTSEVGQVGDENTNKDASEEGQVGDETESSVSEEEKVSIDDACDY